MKILYIFLKLTTDNLPDYIGYCIKKFIYLSIFLLYVNSPVECVYSMFLVKFITDTVYGCLSIVLFCIIGLYFRKFISIVVYIVNICFRVRFFSLWCNFIYLTEGRRKQSRRWSYCFYLCFIKIIFCVLERVFDTFNLHGVIPLF